MIPVTGFDPRRMPVRVPLSPAAATPPRAAAGLAPAAPGDARESVEEAQAPRVTIPHQVTRKLSDTLEFDEDGSAPVVWKLAREFIDPVTIAHLSIEGEPVSKARARFTSYGSPRRIYTPEKTRSAEEMIEWHFRRARPDWRVDSEHGYGVIAIFFCGTRQRRDIDNMLKLILDACNKIVWLDDAQVSEVSGRRVYDVDHPRTEIAIYRAGGSQKMTKPCERCGKPIVIFKSTAQRRFCGMACAYDQRRHKICPTCGTEFGTSARTDQQHCSRTCADTAANVEVVCTGCEKPFTKVRSWVRKTNYCTPECHAEYWKHHRTSSPKGKCQICGAPVSRKEYKRCNTCRIAGRQVTQ